MSAPERREVWTRYWARGPLHSCVGSFGGNYGGSIDAFWREAFAALRPGDAMLDLCAGNGALSQLLVQARPHDTLHCTMADLATPAPQWLRGLPASVRVTVSVRGGVAAEQLPFADGSFALVASQYGLEYTDLPRSIAEVHRVRAPGARVRLVVHHAQSRPVQLAADEVSHIDWLLAEGSLVDAGARMAEPVARSVTAEGRASLAADAQAHAARERFNACQDELVERAGAATAPDVLFEVREAVAQVLATAAASGVEAAFARLDAVRAELADSRLRLVELQRHALDSAAAADLAARLVRPGDRSRVDAVTEAGHSMGWAIAIDPAA